MTWCMTIVAVIVFKKVIMVMNLFNLLMFNRARMRVQVSRCWNQSSQQYRLQHQERINRSLNDELKDFVDKNQGLVTKGKKTIRILLE